MASVDAMEVTHASVARKKTLRISEGHEAHNRPTDGEAQLHNLQQRPAVEGCGVALCLPLVDPDPTSPRAGQVLAALECSCAIPGAFTPEEMHFAQALADTAAQAMSRILVRVLLLR